MSLDEAAVKAELHRYLVGAREAMLWKLDGLSEYDVRRPLTPTGTNLLGLVKHLTYVEAGYFGVTFDRPFAHPILWFEEGVGPNDDFWARADEPREGVVRLYREACAHADATIDTLDLGAVGRVPWWGEGGEATLHRILVHVATETYRHLGHADIVRELADGAVGFMAQDSDIWDPPDGDWVAHRARLEDVARTFR